MTPTCNTCDTKFPGKEICKLCGSDPNAPANLEWKIAQTKIKRVAELNARAVEIDVKFEFNAEPLIEGMKKTSGAFKAASAFTARDIARVFRVPTRLVVDHKRMVKERATRRALVRSLQSARTSQRHVKHGRVGVR